MKMNGRFMVEICLKRRMAPFSDDKYICGYVEVVAMDKYYALHKGFYEFEAKYKKMLLCKSGLLSEG